MSDEEWRSRIVRVQVLKAKPTRDDAALVVIYPTGDDFGKIVTLQPSTETTIGRSTKVDISVDRDSVSREHCRIYTVDGEFFVEDMGSTNGTYVNDVPIQRCPLRDSDFLKTGSVIFKFLSSNGIERSYHEEIHRELQDARARRAAETLSGQVTQVTSMLSAFIAYGEPDVVFARKLNAALKEHGVKTWFYEDDAVPGEKIHRQAADKINKHDRVIVICSENSIGRNGVLTEIDVTLDREAAEGSLTRLIPVSLDRAVFKKGWAPADRQAFEVSLTRRNVLLFDRWQDDAVFEKQLRRLLGVLQRPGEI